MTSEWSTRISPSPPCQLINPSKNEVGKISKIVLEKINKKLLKELDFNQWKNTDDAIRWFRNIQNKSECKFIQLDIKEFYPSITEKSKNNAITFAENYIPISKEYIRTIKHCRSFTEMKHGRNKTLIPHVMSQWGATMVRNSASLLGYIYTISLNKYNFKR